MPQVPETQQDRELPKKSPHAWIFDVDGTLTNPELKIVEVELLGEITKRLQKGEPVSFNTGRLLKWLVEKVIKPLQERVADKSILANLIVVSEKGGTWLTFGDEGERQEFIDSAIFTPQALQQSVRNLIDERYSQVMFYDETKQTMISVEMKDGVTIQKYRPLQTLFKHDLEKLLRDFNLEDNYKIDTSSIAVDIQSVTVGKDLGARKILAWLRERMVSPKVFITFGDSQSDFAMPYEIHQQGFNVIFVFVGEKGELGAQNLPFEVTYTKFTHDQGTLDYLKSFPEET